MQSDAKDVDEYLAEVDESRREALTRLREYCLQILEGYEESMEYGMPSYSKDGVVEVGFASQKRYISFYLLKEDVINEHRDLLEGLSVGKGCIRYSNPKKIDFEVVQKLLEEHFRSNSPVC